MAEGGKVVEGADGADGADVAAIYCEIVRTPLGIGFMALWGFGAKCAS